MKTNNRPMVKETQCEYVCSNLDCFPQFKFWKNKELKVERCSWCYSTHNQTGNTREVERPMNDTEYIEYLETKINYNQNCNCFLACNDKDVCLYQQLLKENQELKELLKPRTKRGKHGKV